MNRAGTLALATVALIALSPIKAAASPQFLVYEGKNAIHDGQGGEKKVVEGIEFWFDGDPPHRYQVLGVITDRRMKTGIYGMIRMHGLEPDIAKMAHNAGGDAVILQGEGDDLIGASSFGSAYATGGRGWASGFGSSLAVPLKAHESRYIVVKYLSDETVGPAPLTPPQPLAAVLPSPPPPATTPPIRPQAPPAQSTRSCGVIEHDDGTARLVKC